MTGGLNLVLQSFLLAIEAIQAGQWMILDSGQIEMEVAGQFPE